MPPLQVLESGSWICDQQSAQPGIGDWYTLPPAGPAAINGVKLALSEKELASNQFLCFDALLDSKIFVTLIVSWLAKDNSVLARQYWSPLTACQTRLVLPIPGGVRQGVVHLQFGVIRRTEAPASLCLSPVSLAAQEPAPLRDPILLYGPLLDQFGQSRLHPIPAHLPDLPALERHLRTLLAEAPAQRWPANFSEWGGWRERQVAATGKFRTHHDGQRWWLVDPAGHLFWSSGMDCVHPTIDHEAKVRTRHQDFSKALAWAPDPASELGAAYHTNPYHAKDDHELNFLELNFRRVFGAEWHKAWTTVAMAELRRLGVNTAGDWSDEAAASATRTPFVLPLDLHFRFPKTPRISGAFPDVFDRHFVGDAIAVAEGLRPYVNDPALIGYFLTNEPSVGWQMIDDRRGVAESMLFSTTGGASRRALADWLRQRHGDDAKLASAWGLAVNHAALADGAWSLKLTAAAQADLTEFSIILLGRLLVTVSAACRAVLPNHLNLGIRWMTFPPNWALRAMKCLDVISFNCYLPRPSMQTYGYPDLEAGVAEVVAKLHKPFMIGEWHFGSLDGGLPSASLQRVADQTARGEAYAGYLEAAAALPWCVGAHWFNLYDRNALYCAASNENYHIGLLTLCHRRLEPICGLARTTHERLYAVAAGLAKPVQYTTTLVYPSR